MGETRLRALGSRLRGVLSELLGAGPLHRSRLQEVDTRIAVSGVRGKSTTVRWLHDVFHGRGYDTYAKVTGTNPISIHNGVEHEIHRGQQVRLYENEREIDKYAPRDVAIVENQGIRAYTTRLVNEQFVRPDVVFLTNVREDHLGTLGDERVTVARALARAVPEGTQVVNGEQDPTIRRYLEAELDRRNAAVSHVTVPDRYRSIPGIECVYGIDLLLELLEEPPLTATQLRAMREELRVSWRQLPDGRVFDAADVNDVQSTELVRRALVEEGETVVEPVLFLRPDRRGRTASFRRYLERLFDDGAIRQVHAIGPDAPVLARRARVPTRTYDVDESDPSEVLDAVLAAGRPVLLMGNTVHEFMEAIQAEIESRATAADEDRVEQIGQRLAGGRRPGRRRGRYRGIRRRHRDRIGASRRSSTATDRPVTEQEP